MTNIKLLKKMGSPTKLLLQSVGTADYFMNIFAISDEQVREEYIASMTVSAVVPSASRMIRKLSNSNN